MKLSLINNNKVNFTTSQTQYIIENHDKEPMLINKVVEITEWLGKELQKNEHLSFVPKRIQILYILADTEKTYHVYGKMKQNQEKPGMYFIPKTQVLEDPYFNEIDIEVDFEKYKKLDTFELKDGTIGRTPYEHQKSGIKFLLTRKGCVLADDMGLGKRIANDVPVLTPNGWVPHGSLKVGDYVIGSNGKATKVLSTHPSPSDDYYKITFTDGTVVESCDEHLWAVQTTNHRKRKSGFKVKPLKDLIGDLTYGTKGNVKWYIPMVESVEFNNRDIKIDPYLLGCLLGDGGISQRSITLSTVDNQLLEECSGRLPLDYFFDKTNGKCDYQLKQQITERTIGTKHSVIEDLTYYKLMGTKSDNKFIPDDYKYNTKEIRLEVLQGLLDTDGYCSQKDGTIQFYSASKQLSYDVKELVQSFGGVARETTKVGKYKKPDGTVIECKLCYILTINLPEGIVPFKLQRKIDNMKTDRKYLPSRGIKTIEYSRTTAGQCISVEADNHLYVIDKYTVTHNTYQSIIAALESGAKKILIVCPSSVKINWEREINYFQCFDTTIVSGRKWSEAKFTIINYDILKNFHALPSKDLKKEHILERHQTLLAANFDLCIIDEAHKLKNKDSKRGAIMAEVCKKVDKVWLLSGTPVANRPMDFYNLLKLIKSPLTKNWKFFAQRYCEGRQITTTLKNGHKKRIWLTNGASNLDELNQKTRNILLRRLKSDIGDMPEKNIIKMGHKFSENQQSDYESLWEEYLIERLEKKKKGEPDRALVELGLLRKFVAMQMIPETIKMAEEIIEQGHKVIIFTNFTEELQQLHKHFSKNGVVHFGEMSDKDKQKSIDKFQKNKKTNVFIGNIISAGVGITLTEGTYVIFNSFDWVPGGNEQAEDRAYRIGQKNNVTVYYQLFENSISEIMWETIQKKQDNINIIMGDVNRIIEDRINKT